MTKCKLFSRLVRLEKDSATVSFNYFVEREKMEDGCVGSLIISLYVMPIQNRFALLQVEKVRGGGQF